MEKIKNNETSINSRIDILLYKALNKYGKFDSITKVVIIGSIIPWYESVAIAFGSTNITTIEDNHKINCTHPFIKILTLEEYHKNPIIFDIGFSISTIEHIGLGRYFFLIIIFNL